MRSDCFTPTRPAKSEHRDDREHDQTCGDVKGMQADQRVIGCSEQVGRDRQPVFVDQPVPFLRRAVEEQTTKRNGEQPQVQGMQM